MYVKTNWVDNTTPIDENNLNKIEQGIKNNDINIGEENYDNTKTYEVGDIVRYNEKIYKCITAITTAENFDISKWEQTNIVEIVQSEKSKIYELIEAISTPIVGEGENITLNDTAEKRFENFDIEGNSKQETRSGKNYLNMFTKYKAGDTTTINGIKFTFNKDGSITCDGTASADATLDFSIPDGGQKINGTDKKLVGLIGGEYSYTKATQCVAYDKNWGNTKYITLVSANKNSTQVMADNIEYFRFRIIVYKDTVINNRTLYLQVLDALQEDLSYEQYGASPSPDYPSEVKSCGDNGSINEVICNKNLFDKETVTNGRFVDYSTGNFITREGYCTSDYIKINSNYITISGTNEQLAFYDKDKNYISGLATSKITDIPTNAKYMIITLQTRQIDSVQIEEGSTATSYEEHQSQSYIIPTQQPMRAIGDTRDTFIKKNNKWYEHHPIVRIESYNGETITSEYISNTGELSTGATVDYISDTPVDIECTEEQSTILFDIERNAKTYKGVTHIYSNDAVSPNCYVEAVKDLTTLIQ